MRFLADVANNLKHFARRQPQHLRQRPVVTHPLGILEDVSELVTAKASGAVGLRRFAASQRGLVTRAQAVQLGCNDSRLMRLCCTGELERAGRGVYRFTAVPVCFEQEALAACLATRGSMACRVTAMRLYGFEPARKVLERHPGPDVTTAVNRQQPKKGPSTVHSARVLATPDRTKRRGVPVTGPVRTLMDVAAIVPAETLERFLGHLLATKALFPSRLQQLATELRHDPHTFARPGSHALRTALQRAGISTSPDSVLEHRAFRLLRNAGVPEPTPQLRVCDGGRLQAVVDFAWPERRIALEVDGFRWHGDPGSFAQDRRRANRLQELGWLVYRTTFAELEEGAHELCRQLKAALGVPERQADLRESRHDRDLPRIA